MLNVTFSIDESVYCANSKITLSNELPLELKQAFIHDTWHKLGFNEEIRKIYYIRNEPRKTRLIDTNPIIFYSIDKEDNKNKIDIINKSIKEIGIEEDVFVYITNTKFLNILDGHIQLIVTNPTKYEKRIYNDIFMMWDFLYIKGLAELRLRRNVIGSVILNQHPTGAKLETKDYDPLKEANNTPWDRDFLFSSTEPIEWATKFKEKSLNTEKTLHKNKSGENKIYIKEERKAIIEGFKNIQNFYSDFEKLYGFKYEDFWNLFDEIYFMTYDSKDDLLIINEDIVIDKFKQQGIDEVTIKKFLSLLIYDGKGESFYFPIWKCNDFIYSHCGRLSQFMRYCHNRLFHEMIFPNIKGKSFHNIIRNELVENKFRIIRELLDIEEEFLPKDISLKFFNRIKTKTDIDIIFEFNEYIFLIECKEIKPNFKHFNRLNNQFNKYSIQMYYLSKWIAKNFKKFIEKYELELSINKDRKIVPIIVSNFPIVNDRKIPIITLDDYNELLKYILKKDSKESLSNIRLGSDRDLKLQIFGCKTN